MNKRKTITKITQASTVCLIALLVGCSKVETPTKEINSIKSVTEFGMSSGNCLVTLEHDNHLFIVNGRIDKGGILHHPDCKCNHTNAQDEERK